MVSRMMMRGSAGPPLTCKSYHRTVIASSSITKRMQTHFSTAHVGVRAVAQMHSALKQNGRIITAPGIIATATDKYMNIPKRSIHQSLYSREDTEERGQASPKEQELESTLRKALDADPVRVQDISGGCGSMFKILVVSPKFQDIPLVKQHKYVGFVCVLMKSQRDYVCLSILFLFSRMVTNTLKQEIGEMHGLTIHTMSPEKYEEKVKQASGHG